MTGASFVESDVKWTWIWGNLSSVIFKNSILDNVSLCESNLSGILAEFSEKECLDIANKTEIVYSRHLSGKDDKVVASLMVPGAIIVNSSLQNVDFTASKAFDLLMNETTYQTLSEKQKIQLKNAGFAENNILTNDDIETVIKNLGWDIFKEERLDIIFQSYHEK